MNRFVIAVLGFAGLASVAGAAGLPEVAPESLGFDPARLNSIDALVERALEEKQVPGAVVVVGRKGSIVWSKAYGRRAVSPSDEAMTVDTIFDMASLTKPVATATSVMLLVERGLLRVEEKVETYLEEFQGKPAGGVTLDQLLRHRSGLIPDNPIGDYQDGVEKAWERIAGLEPQSRPGTRFRYSDVNFLILGRIVERVSGRPLDAFFAENVAGPLGLKDSGFRRIGADSAGASVDRIAPTEPAEAGQPILRGVVHDPRASSLGGVAGHAGLFSTAGDLAVYAQTLLNGGVSPGGTRLLSPLTVRAMVDPGETPAGERRALGWDVNSSFSAPKGELFGPAGFGHTGFTGTSLWVDLETQTFVILLTSRLHPDGKAASPTKLRRALATLVAAAIVDAESRPSGVASQPGSVEEVRAEGAVLCGIDVLEKGGFEPLKGKRVGLVTNHTGRTVDGRATIDVIHGAPGVSLVALFSPEHGIRGAVDRPVDDSKDEKTGLPVYSLYGKNRKPTPEQLKDVDVLVYDIQDIGCRFYTYISTLGLVMEAAKERGIPLVVLDRPNPVGGVAVEGPVRDEGFDSFVAYHDIPVRHGLTVGELARLFNAERKTGADLTVVSCEGWRRGDLYDRTGLLWVNPSPNMRSLTEALLYPGVGLLEFTNVAVGRGTDTPFERFGAPWIEPRAFAKALNELALPGVRFVPIRFTPAERQHKGEECGGVSIVITDREALNAVDLGMALAVTLRKLYPEKWETKRLVELVCDKAVVDAVLAGRSVSEVRELWSEELDRFRQRRAPHLLYPE